MLRWLSVLVGLGLVIAVGCAKPNYLVDDTDEDDYIIISDSVRINQEKNKDNDTQKVVNVDTGHNIVAIKDTAKISFAVDMASLTATGNDDGTTNGVLAKTSAVKTDRAALANFRKNKCVQVYMIIEDSLKKTREYYFWLKDGKYSGTVTVPLGYKYTIITYLRYAVTCPWDTSYQLIDAPFWAQDTVDCRSSSNVTFDLSFKEITALSFFFELSNPFGSYTEKGKYYILESVGRTGRPATYEGGKLKHWLYVGNLGVTTASIRVIDSKGDTISIGLSFNLDAYVTNNCLVSISGANVKIGTADFDYQKSLQAVDAVPYYGGFRISYNKNCDVYPDSISKLRVYKVVGTDSTRIDTLGTASMNVGFVWWHKKSPIDHLPIGNYVVKAEVNFAKDEYGFRQTAVLTRAITVTIADIPKP
jgi:hypothetical protein